MTLEEYLAILDAKGEAENVKLYSVNSAKIDSIDEDERTVTAIISTGSVDRDREVLSPKGAEIDTYMDNPVVLWSHDPKVPIGKALWVKKMPASRPNKLIAKVEFAPKDVSAKAEEIWQLFKGGFLKSFSVGFRPLKGHVPTPEEIKKNPDLAEAFWIFDEWELLEFSPVSVPANPEALALAIKSNDINLSDEMKKELEVIEAEQEILKPVELKETKEVELNIPLSNAEVKLKAYAPAVDLKEYGKSKAQEILDEEMKKRKGIMY